MAVATRPTFTVQVAFDDGAMVASPTWTTIPARSARIARGRSDETQRFGPGTATVVVPNAARLFDPSNSAGTYFGKLLPMRQLRVRATYNAVTYEVFRGHVEGWPQKYNESNRDAYVELVANDALTYLSNIDLPTWQAYVPTVAAPTWWYPLDDNNDGEDFNVVHEIIGGWHGVYQHDDVNDFLDFSQEPLAPTGNSVRFEGGVAKLDAGAMGLLAADQTWSVGLVFVRQGRPVAGNFEVLLQSGFGLSSYSDFSIYISPDDGWVYLDTANASSIASSGVDLCDGLPHSVIVTRNSTVALGTKLYIDGGGPSETTWTSTEDWEAQTHIGAPVGPNEPLWEPFTGRIDEVIGWNSVLSATQAGKIGLAMISFNGQTPAERVTALLDVAGWPTALRDIDSDGPTLGPATLGGKLLSELQTTEASEQGRMFITADGTFTLHSRWRDRTASAAMSSQATFADDGADHKYLARGFEYGYEVDRIVNHCTVSGTDGLSYTASDATSIAAYGLRSRTINTLITTVLELRNLAEFMVLRYKTPVLRAKSFSVNAERAPTTMWPAVLGLEIGERVTLQRTPQNVGSQISTALLVERIEHDIDQDKWETKLLGSPVDPNTESATTYWVLGTSTFDSQTVLYF